MDRVKRAALILDLINRLRANGNWCGETHIQKAMYFLQEMLKVQLGFVFILYKHGPFSFDLRDELTGLRADELLAFQLQQPYGPRFITTERAKHIQDVFSLTLAAHDKQIGFVARKLGEKGVADLERLATALFVTLKTGDQKVSPDDRARELNKLKPHVSEDAARVDVAELDQIEEDWRAEQC